MAWQYVGGTSGVGTSTGYTISLSGTLTGGIASSPSAGDLVVVFSGFGNTASSAPAVSGNTSGAYIGATTAQHVNDTWDTEFRSFYQVMGGTPDTTLTVTRVTNAAYGGATTVQVWRGVNPVSPFIGAGTNASAGNTSLINPPAYNPAVTNALIIAGGAGTQAPTSNAFTGFTGMSNFITNKGDGTTADCATAMASYDYAGVSYDPPVVSGGTGGNASSSWAGVTIAFRMQEDHPTSGSLTGQGSEVVGSADRQSPSVNHATTGDLTGQLGSMAGSATRFRAFATTGALSGQGSALSGSADRQDAPAAVTHDTSGAITGQIGTVAGTAVHNAKHVAQGGDPHRASVVLGLHMDGANGSTSITDVTGKSITVGGNAQLSTAQAKFGESSAYFDGGNDWFNVGATADLNFGTGDFTVEMFVYVIAHTNANAALFASGNTSWSGGATLLRFNTGAKLNWHRNEGLSITTGTATIATGQWYHIALARSGSTIRTFVNGTVDGSSSIGAIGINFNTNNKTYIGHSDIDDLSLNGYIDDLRVTKGVARYTGNFTPPTAPFDYGTGLIGQAGALSGSADRQDAPSVVTHNTSGTLSGQGASIVGSAAKVPNHQTTGALAGSGSSVSGVATRFRTHATSGALTGQLGSVSGTAVHRPLHSTSGALVGQTGSVAGSAARMRAHAAIGALTAQLGSMVGSAIRSNGPITHSTSGALTGAGAQVSGSAARTRNHAVSGVLSGQNAIVVGDASRSSGPVSHGTSGALSGQSAALSGAASRTRLHETSGAIIGQLGLLSGTAARTRVHEVTGELIGDASVLTGDANHSASAGVTISAGAARRLTEIWQRMELDAANPVTITRDQLTVGSITQVLAATGMSRTGTMAAAGDSEQQILEIWQRWGLDPSNPLTQSQVAIDVGAIHIDLAGDGINTTTATRT